MFYIKSVIFVFKDRNNKNVQSKIAVYDVKVSVILFVEAKFY